MSPAELTLYTALALAFLSLCGVVIGQRLWYRYSVALETRRAIMRAVPEISAGLARIEASFSGWLDPLAGYAARRERRAALETHLIDVDELYEREKFWLDEATRVHVRSVLGRFRYHYSEIETMRSLHMNPSHAQTLYEAVNWLERYQEELRPDLERQFLALTSGTNTIFAIGRTITRQRALPHTPRDLDR